MIDCWSQFDAIKYLPWFDQQTKPEDMQFTITWIEKQQILTTEKLLQWTFGHFYWSNELLITSLMIY